MQHYVVYKVILMLWLLAVTSQFKHNNVNKHDNFEYTGNISAGDIFDNTPTISKGKEPPGVEKFQSQNMDYKEVLLDTVISNNMDYIGADEIIEILSQIDKVTDNPKKVNKLLSKAGSFDKKEPKEDPTHKRGKSTRGPKKIPMMTKMTRMKITVPRIRTTTPTITDSTTTFITTSPTPHKNTVIDDGKDIEYYHKGPKKKPTMTATTTTTIITTTADKSRAIDDGKYIEYYHKGPKKNPTMTATTRTTTTIITTTTDKSRVIDDGKYIEYYHKGPEYYHQLAAARMSNLAHLD